MKHNLVLFQIYVSQKKINFFAISISLQKPSEEGGIGQELNTRKNIPILSNEASYARKVFLADFNFYILKVFVLKLSSPRRHES